MHTFLFLPSIHLNKSLTILKNTFRETAYRDFYGRKIWQRHEYYFLRQPRSKVLCVSKLLGCILYYSSPHFIWTSSWLDWRTLFVKLHTDTIWGQNLTTTWVLFFVENPHQRILLFRNLLVCIHSYSSIYFIWTGSWLDRKTHFVKLHADTFWGQNLTTTWVIFSWTTHIKNFFLFQNLLGCINSYSSPHSIWTSPWLDWKTIFVKLHTKSFMGVKFDNDMRTFFIKNPNQKFFLFQNLLGCIHSSTYFIWTGSWLDRKTLFVKLHTDTFWMQNLSTTSVLFW